MYKNFHVYSNVFHTCYLVLFFLIYCFVILELSSPKRSLILLELYVAKALTKLCQSDRKYIEHNLWILFYTSLLGVVQYSNIVNDRN